MGTFYKALSRLYKTAASNYLNSAPLLPTMRQQLDTLIDELKCLKNEGIEDIYLSDPTLEDLRQAISTKLTTPSLPTTISKTSKPAVAHPSQVSRQRLPPHLTLPEGNPAQQWEWLRQRVLECPECQKHVKPGRQVVFGIGPVETDLFFCGEAPGADEERQGEPFVGPAGKLLTKIIQAMGLQRNGVYIGNIMNWRPETANGYGNRPPTDEEIAFCLPYLQAQVQIVQPKVLIALGKTAAKGLLGADGNRRMSELRGQWFDFHGIPLRVTYHPSYLLHNETLKAKRAVWEDMIAVMEKIALPLSDKQRAFFLPKTPDS